MNDWRTHLDTLVQSTRAGAANTQLISFTLGISIVALFRILRWISTPSGNKVTTTVHQSSHSNKNRDPGTWTPEKFDYPDITPCLDALVDIKPVLYRPFRWGEYHVTMGIRSMPWSEWIELDSGFQSYQRVRQFRLRTRGQEAVRVLPGREDDVVSIPGGADAAKELVYELVEYLCRRYPSSFRITRWDRVIPTVCDVPLGWHGQMPVQTIEVVDTGTVYDLSELEMLDGTEMGEAAMRIVTGLVQEDMAIMIEGTDGKYYLQAASVCTAGFWRLKDKIGRPLHEIHLSGNVPQYKEKLQTSMERYFRRMAVDTPVVRNNYFIQVVKPNNRAGEQDRSDIMEEEMASEVDPEELGWSESTNGPEDDLQHGHGHSAKAATYLAPETIRIRSERQTLRRLPRTGAIVFGIHTYLYKVQDLVRERGVAGRLASAIRSWPEGVATYKGREMYGDVLVGYLDECAEREGVVSGPVEGMLGYPY